MANEVPETQVTTFTHVRNNTFFFSTDHCQGVNRDGSIVHDDWVPASCTLPLTIRPRKGHPKGFDGVVGDVEVYIDIFHKDERLIRNPNPRYEPGWVKEALKGVETV